MAGKEIPGILNLCLHTQNLELEYCQVTIAVDKMRCGACNTVIETICSHQIPVSVESSYRYGEGMPFRKVIR